MKHPAILAALLLALPCGLLRADILDLNAGLDRNNPGNWTFSLGTARDNVLSNGDTFLAQNAGHFHKAPYGATDGTTGAEGSRRAATRTARSASANTGRSTKILTAWSRSKASGSRTDDIHSGPFNNPRRSKIQRAPTRSDTGLERFDSAARKATSMEASQSVRSQKWFNTASRWAKLGSASCRI